MLAVGGDGGRCSMQRLLRNYFTMLTTVGGVARPELRPEAWLQKENGKLARTRYANLDSWVARTAALSQEGWHFSCERGCTRDDYGKAGPFSVERLKMGLPFVNVLSVHTEHSRRAGPFSVARLKMDLPFRLKWTCLSITVSRSHEKGQPSLLSHSVLDLQDLPVHSDIPPRGHRQLRSGVFRRPTPA